MKNIILSLLLILGYSHLKAQFNTIQMRDKTGYVILEREKITEPSEATIDSLVLKEVEEQEQKNKISFREARKKPPRTKGNNNFSYSYIETDRLQGLSIKNLYQEIIDNGIKHPKIVLAQAILETGWFKSSVCRNKGNLFGLTNPKTGEYYEYDHWKESIKAYRDKVQYKYRGGNYLLWLQEIGYAEDPRYVSSLIKLLEQHFL